MHFIDFQCHFENKSQKFTEEKKDLRVLKSVKEKVSPNLILLLLSTSRKIKAVASVVLRVCSFFSLLNSHRRPLKTFGLFYQRTKVQKRIRESKAEGEATAEQNTTFSYTAAHFS